MSWDPGLASGHIPKAFAVADDAVFVKGAVHEVEIALGLSVTMVLIVIYIFLLDWRATLIPGLSMPVAMIGTIAAIYLAGFTTPGNNGRALVVSRTATSIEISGSTAGGIDLAAEGAIALVTVTTRSPDVWMTEA